MPKRRNPFGHAGDANYNVRYCNHNFSTQVRCLKTKHFLKGVMLEPHAVAAAKQIYQHCFFLKGKGMVIGQAGVSLMSHRLVDILHPPISRKGKGEMLTKQVSHSPRVPCLRVRGHWVHSGLIFTSHSPKGAGAGHAGVVKYATRTHTCLQPALLS